MKVGIYSFYFDAFGGGEKYVLSVADYFLRRGDEVTIFSGDKLTPELIFDRFQMDLSKAQFDQDIFGKNVGLIEKLTLTKKFDVFFFLSNGSVPTSFAKHNFLHFQMPFNSDQKNIGNKLKLSRFEKVICNSEFTKNYIDKSFGVKSVVLYPPIDVDNFKSGKKTNTILSVGRFFADPHNKKQEVLIDTFIKHSEAEFKNWRLILIGGVDDQKKDKLNFLKEKIQGYPIEIVENGMFDQLRKAYAQAKIYWHAAGFGEDISKYPDRAEHFGMSTVEAMAAGAVPIVFPAGGQTEIVSEEVDGLFWHTQSELVAKSCSLIKNEKLWMKLSQNAQEKAKSFSRDRFFQDLEKIVTFNV